jgi:hypothetical protein
VARLTDPGARDIAPRAPAAAFSQISSPRFAAVTPAARTVVATACAARRALACKERTSCELASVWMCAPLVRHAARMSAVAAPAALLSASSASRARARARRTSALALTSAATRRTSRRAFLAIAAALLPRPVRAVLDLVLDFRAMKNLRCREHYRTGFSLS